MILSLAVLAASAVPAAPAVLALPLATDSTTPVVADDHSARWYDLRAIVAAGAPAPAGVDLRLHLSVFDGSSAEGPDVALGTESSLTMELCVAAIEAAIGADSAAKLVGIDARAGLIRVTGNDAAQAAAARTVVALGEVMDDSVNVEVFRIDDALLPHGMESVLDSATASELIEGLDGIAAHRRSVRVGRSAGLGEENSTTVLYDYDVEIAQGAVATDPMVIALSTGFRVGVRVDRASDGRRLVVRVWGRDGELAAPLERFAIASMGDTPIELPEVATSMWTSSAIVEPGAAIVIDHDGGGRSALVIRVSAPKGSMAPAALLPLGELALRPMRPSVPFLAAASPSGGRPWPRDDMDLARGLAPRLHLEDGAPAAFIQVAFEEILQGGLALPFGSALLLPTPFATDGPAGEILEGLREALPVATTAVDLRYSVLPSSVARTELESGNLQALADSADGRLLGCGVDNDALMLVGGVEYAYLMDYDIQIAAGAIVGDPIVHHVFEGIAVWCTPLRNADGRISAWFDVQAHAPTPRMRSVDTSSYHPGGGDGDKDLPVTTGTFELDQKIQLPVTHRAAIRTLVQASEGEWSLVMAQPLTGTDTTLIVLTRMTTH